MAAHTKQTGSVSASASARRGPAHEALACALRENRPLEKLVKNTGFHVELADGPALRWVLALAPSDDAVKR